MGFGTGSDDLKLARLFPGLAFAVEARLADEALSVLLDIVALLIFLLPFLLLIDPSLLNILLFCSLPDVDDVAIDPTFVLLDMLLAFSLLSKFFAFILRLSGSQTDLERTEPNSRRLKAVGIRLICLFLVSSSLSLDEDGKELNEESTIGSTLEILSHRFNIGSVPSDSFTFSNDDIIGKRIGGNRKSLLVDVECDASVSCEALLSEKFTRLSEGLAVELLCSFLMGDTFDTFSLFILTLESLLLVLKSESSVSTCCKDITTSGRLAVSIVCISLGITATGEESNSNSFSTSSFLGGLVVGKHLFSDLK